MSLVLWVFHRGRDAFFEHPHSECLLGRDPNADICLLHPKIAPRHARLLLRRNKLILADLGALGASTHVGGQKVAAPTILEPGQRFGLGELTLAAWPGDPNNPSWAGRSCIFGPIGAERPSPDPSVRRYEIGSGELLVTNPEVDPARWIQVGLSPQQYQGRWIATENVPVGVRLSLLLSAAERGALFMPPEAGVVLALGLLAALGQYAAPHGCLEPARVQLGEAGQVQLLAPDAQPGMPPLTPWLAPERRLGATETVASDTYSVAALVRALLPGAPWSRPLAEAMAPIDRRTDPATLRQTLWSAALSAGLDPTAQHLGRVVRLLRAQTRPLAKLGPSR